MTPRKLFFAIPIVALLVFAVVPGALHAQTGADPDVVIVTGEDNGQTINLEVGNILRLELESNPTTGYDWMPDPVNWVSTIKSTVTVIDVLPGSPAEAAGLVPGDVIYAMNGDPQVSSAVFDEQLAEMSGQDVTLTVARGRGTEDVSLTADEFPAGDNAFVYIFEVVEGSPAEEAGFLPEEIVQSVDGVPITSTQQLIDYVQSHEGQEITVTVGRPPDVSLDITVTPTADETGTIRVGLGVLDLTPSIIGATVADFNIEQEVGLLDETSDPETPQLILKLLDLEPEFTPSDSDADGSGGTAAVRFIAQAPGETTLRLYYAATFEENPEPTETFEIHIVISGEPTPDAAQTLTDADNGAEVSLEVGDSLRLELESNPSTGYQWVLDEALDQSVLQQVGEAEYVGEPDPAPGSGGTDIWTFAAVGSGTTTITLNLLPPGETTPFETFTVTVEVD